MQKIVFDDEFEEYCEKIIYFTATPLNKNNVIMSENNDDYEEFETNNCGKLYLNIIILMQLEIIGQNNLIQF